MILKKTARWHIVFWIAVFTLFNIPLYIYGIRNSTLYILISFLMYVGVFYLNIFRILPKWIQNKNIWILLMIWLILIIACTFISILLNHLLDVFTRDGQLHLEIVNSFLKNILFVGIVLFIGITYTYFADRIKSEKKLHELETEKLKTELSFLKTQINPHFLFNTLNNIYSLAYSRSEKTSESIMMLSEIMRYMLYDSNASLVPLSREIHYLKLLTSLHQLRINGPIMLEFTVEGDIESCMIAPLLLISFVENILKHGILNDPSSPAQISVSIKDNRLYFYSRNKINYGLKDVDGGIGLANVKRRIDLLYSGKHDLQTSNDTTYYTVNLILNL